MSKKINIIFAVIAVVAIVLTTVIIVFKPLGQTSSSEEGTTRNAISDGFHKINGEWIYYENSERTDKSQAFHGTVNDMEGMWMTVNGKVDFSLNSLEKKENSWQYVKNGAVSEKTDAEALFIMGEVLDSLSDKKEIEVFGDFEITPENMSLLQAEIDKNSAKGYELGIVVMNVNSLGGFSYNADGRIYSASVIKGPYITSLVKSDNSLLEKERVRIEAALIRSSNVDYESLRDTYGDDCFVNFLSATGSDFQIDTTRNFQYLTPRALANLWTASYVFFESGETGEELGQIFEKPVISPIKNIFSDKFTTRTKAGWIVKNNIEITNDAGIVYTDNGDYVVVIMTTAPSNFKVVENLAEAIEKCL